MTNTNEVKLPRRSQLRKWPGKCFLIVMLLATRVISTAQTFTTLVNLDGSNGIATNSLVASSLVQATNGSLYGTTNSGGMYNFGTIFKITPAGTLTTIYNFNLADGAGPVAGLVQATNGYLYGTTIIGGINGADGHGTIFRITPAGALTTMHRFRSSDGAGPTAGLVQATDGSLYGTTPAGGSNNYGTIFKITTNGTFTSLHSFDATGTYPQAGLVQDTNGSFYGATSGGGTGDGTLFELSMGLGPFVKTLPTWGEVGSAVKILGTNLTGATSVTFNGTPAVFTVVSAAEITTTVPAGATSGNVQVVTPNATLTSNVAFQVP